MKYLTAPMACGILTLILFTGIVCTANGREPAPVTAEPTIEWIKTEIFFGSNLPGGQQISRWAWADFMDKVITPQFPQGMTVYDAYGQMRHADGRIEKQFTWVVMLLHPGDAAVEQKIQAVIEAYRSQFNKAQVTIVSTPAMSVQFFPD